MSLLVLSPDFASHYGPLAVLADAARRSGKRVVVATGEALRARVESDGFEWRLLQLGAASNDGIAARNAAIERFIEATARGPAATLRLQALERESDLLWQPERVVGDVVRLCDEIEPERILVDHVSFGSTLAVYATGRPFITVVPGHPSQLPVGAERYGIPVHWPVHMQLGSSELSALHSIADRVTRAFTARWNEALAAVAPDRSSVDDAFRVHGDRVLFNSVNALHEPARTDLLPKDHRFVGPLVRHEELPVELRAWEHPADGPAQVYVALGTFLSHRGDVLLRVADALAHLGVRAAMAVGSTPVGQFGPLPANWIVAEQLPQVAMLRSADLSIHHGGNNSVQESLAAGVRQLVMPFSTDQFSNAADLERIGAACVRSPNDSSSAELALAIEVALASPRRAATPLLAAEQLCDAMFSPVREPVT
jgi:zeaxanthin glucosyltransferase